MNPLKPTFLQWVRIRVLNILWGVQSPSYGDGKQGWRR